MAIEEHSSLVAANILLAAESQAKEVVALASHVDKLLEVSRSQFPSIRAHSEALSKTESSFLAGYLVPPLGTRPGCEHPCA